MQPQPQQFGGQFAHAQGQPHYMRHDWTPGHPEDDFLVPPEAGIGPVISASTNRTKTGWHPATAQQKAQRVGLVILGVIFGGLGGVFAGMALKELMLAAGIWIVQSYEGELMLLGGIAGAIVGTIGFLLLAMLMRRPQSSYIGKHGVQRYTRGLLFGPKSELFRFDDAAELKVQRIRQFVNGAYTGTSYDYTWRARDGKVAFKIAGSYRDDKAVESADPVSFAFASESAWSEHRIAYFDRQIAQQGVARFQCGADSIGIGKGFLEIGSGAKTQRIPTSGGMKDIYFEQGLLVIKETGAKEGWFSSTGVYRFPVAALSDFRVFLIVLQEQTGIKFG